MSFLPFLTEQAFAQAARCPMSWLPCGGINAITAVPEGIASLAIDVFYGLLFLMLLVYAITLIVGSTNEGTLEEVRKAFTYALLASALVHFSDDILNVVRPYGPILNPNALTPLFSSVFEFIKVVAAAGAAVFIIVRAISLIAAGANEGDISTQRKMLLNAVIGVGVVVLAEEIVNAALGDSGILSVEALGIAQYILYILGALMVASIAVGAAMLILSYDEGLQERAKKAILASVIVLIVLLCLGALISLL